MNQLIQYVLIFGVTGVFFAALYAASLQEVSDSALSHNEMFELYKRQAGEHIMLVGFVRHTPSVAVDIVNVGNPVVLVDMYADGSRSVPTVSLPDGRVLAADEPLETGKAYRVTAAGPGTEVAVATENGRVFKFG